MTDDALRPMFEAYGTVESLRIMTDRDTGRSRGFAFVVMKDTAEAERAIAALNGAVVDGRALNVNEARPQTTSGGGAKFARKPGGGAGGGGGRQGSGGRGNWSGERRERWS